MDHQPSTPTMPELGIDPVTPEGVPDGAPASAIAPPEYPTITDQPVTPETPPKAANKSYIFAILILLACLALGAGGFFLYRHFSSPQTPQQQSQSNTTDTPVEPEIETPLATDEASELFRRILILHHPDFTDYISYAQDTSTYTEDQYFTFNSGYSVSDSIYSTDGLSNKDKLYIATSYMRGLKQLKTAEEYNVPVVLYSAIAPSYCETAPTDPLCSSNQDLDAASEEEVTEAYAMLFGEDPSSHENPTAICGGLVYNAEYHIYHAIPAGCGGFDGPSHQAYVEKYTETSTAAYAYVRIATIDTRGAAKAPVYTTHFGAHDLYDENQPTPDESFIYSYLDDIDFLSTTPRVITSDNYTDFDTYRFIFDKTDDSYTFNSVEKIEA